MMQSTSRNIELLKMHDIAFDVSILDYGNYDKISFMNRKDEVVVEATRVILNEQFDKIANLTLSQAYFQPNRCSQNQNKHASPIDGTEQNEVVNLKRNTIKKNKTIHNEKHYTIKNNEKLNNNLERKYFKLWKRSTKKQFQGIKQSHEQEDKINKFVENFKCMKELKVEKPKMQICKSTNSVGLYDNRFKAQQFIIDRQKEKIAEQSRLIEDLKLGIIREEVANSMEKSQIYIREILKCSSVQTKLLIAPKFIETTKGSVSFAVNSNKAPKIVQKMEKRALERAKNRQLIYERKQLIDQEKKYLIEEAVKKKRAQDEEERRKNLEAVKLRQLKELELQNIRRVNKQKYIDSVTRVETFYRLKLLRLGLDLFVRLIDQMKINLLKSEIFFEKKLKEKCYYAWINYIECKKTEEHTIAFSFYRQKLLKAYINKWKLIYHERIRANQVAIDVYTMKLQTWTFKHWRNYTTMQNFDHEKQSRQALKHYHNRILFQYFYQWRSLPFIIQLEKRKEEKKKKWRKRVLEIVPDYKPTECF